MDITKSEYDTNEYRVIKLENEVVALLISKKHREENTGRNSQLIEKEQIDEKAGEYEEGEGEGEGEETEVVEDGLDEQLTDSEGSDGVEDDDDEDESVGNYKSACAVCIKAGSFSDPPDIPGLAHLLEHMVFMGSEKYRGERTFDEFVSRHGGLCNASTDYERTVFHFTIIAEHFKKALDMFAHFFASPLLDESSLDREIEAVDSEFKESVQDDEDRLDRLLCSVADTDHPYSTFVWGNTESLRHMPQEKGINLAENLREFYRRHYSSHYMTVAILSTDPLDDLEQWTRASFSAIPHNELPAPDFSKLQPAFNGSKFHKLFKVVPVANENGIQLTWHLPCLFDRYRVKPLDYLAQLLGHEGEGSVLHYLKRKNLAVSLVAGNGTNGHEYNSCLSLFTCTLTVTDKGQDQILECLNCIFQYLRLLREAGPQERIYRELQLIERNKFIFKEPEDLMSYVEELCEAMQFYPEADYLTGNSLFFEYDPKVIKEVTDLLVPDEVNIMWSSQQFREQCQLKEKWFGTQYSCEDIPIEWKEEWKTIEVPDYLHLPLPNPFIAKDFTIKVPPSAVSKYPEVLDGGERVKLWFRQDTVFKLPKASVCLLLENPLHKSSAENAVRMDMFMWLLELNMTNDAYNAFVAQLKCSVDIENRGLTITVSGLNEKLLLLFKKVIDELSSFSTTQEDFDMGKESLHRCYQNGLLQLEEHCRSVRKKILIVMYWSSSQKDSVLDGLTLPDLLDFVAQFKVHMFAEMLVQGNMLPEEAKDLSAYVLSKMNFDALPLEKKFKPCAKRLLTGKTVCVDVQSRDLYSPNTVITDYYQCCCRNVRDTTIASFLSSCMEEPAFDELRTKQQLGYEAYPQNHNTHDVVGLSLTVITQSAKHSVQRVMECMQNFISGFHKTLQSWSAEEFHSHVSSAIEERLEPDVSLEKEVERNWEEVILGYYQFDWHLKEVEILRELTQPEVCDWLLKYTQSGDDFKKLQVKVLSKECESETDGPASSDVILVKECDIETFKDTLPSYPTHTA